MTFVRSIAPTEGRIPNKPFTLAGKRTDPPVSEPIPTSSQSWAPVLVPAPVDEPDGEVIMSPRAVNGAW